MALLVCLAPALAASDTATLTLQGTISASCGLSAPSGAVDLGDISVPGSRNFAITVDCNAPFAYAVVSSNQALTADAPPPVLGGAFDTTLPYTLTTQFETDGANFGDTAISSAAMTDAAAAPCLAAAFDAAGCPYANSGDAVAINKTGTLTVNWGGSVHPLTAGTFTDTITLTVRVQT
jgi:hypothetical protein